MAREGITIMCTDFERGKVSVKKTLLYSANGGPDRTWELAVRETRLLNAESGERFKYWIKYR